jgi:hypothetical protein
MLTKPDVYFRVAAARSKLLHVDASILEVRTRNPPETPTLFGV